MLRIRWIFGIPAWVVARYEDVLVVHQPVQALCDELLERAARNGRIDLIRDYALPVPLTIIGALIEAEEEGDKLSEVELIAMIGLLLFAGYETTVNLISTGALMLMERPEERERFLSTPQLAESRIEELLRFTSPADFATPRVARARKALEARVSSPAP